MSRPRSVVDGILRRARVRLPVTACPALPRVPLAVLGVLAAALDRGPHVAFERRRHTGPQQPRPCDRPRPEPLPHDVGGLDSPTPSIVTCPEHAELLALAEA